MAANRVHLAAWVTGDRRARILGLLGAGGLDAGAGRLCEVCAQATGATGAGLMLMAGDVSRGSVCTTDPVSALIERLQYDLGEGPCLDAFHQDAPVSEPDLASPIIARWPAFRGPVLAAGARAVFGFPLRVGGVRLGAMNLYDEDPGPLTDEEHADALVMATVAAEVILGYQAGAAPGAVAEELAVAGEFRYVVHQAAGVMAVRLDVPVGEALVRLRAHAFALGRPLDDVAAEIVTSAVGIDSDACSSDHGNAYPSDPEPDR